MSTIRTTRISEKAINLIKEFESFEEYPYQCSSVVWTIGWGNTYCPDGSRVNENTPPISKEQADQWLLHHLESVEKTICSNVKVNINQVQYDALVSFVYNIGSGQFEESTMLKKLNNEDYKGAAAEFMRWTKSRGKVKKGLIKRRKLECALFVSEDS